MVFQSLSILDSGDYTLKLVDYIITFAIDLVIDVKLFVHLGAFESFTGHYLLGA